MTCDHAPSHGQQNPSSDLQLARSCLNNRDPKSKCRAVQSRGRRVLILRPEEAWLAQTMGELLAFLAQTRGPFCPATWPSLEALAVMWGAFQGTYPESKQPTENPATQHVLLHPRFLRCPVTNKVFQTAWADNQTGYLRRVLGATPTHQ